MKGDRPFKKQFYVTVNQQYIKCKSHFYTTWIKELPMSCYYVSPKKNYVPKYLLPWSLCLFLGVDCVQMMEVAWMSILITKMHLQV